MRLLHPKTIKICAKIGYKTVIAHAWAEVFKYLASKQTHPKMFIKSEYYLGLYLQIVYRSGISIGCKFDNKNVNKLDQKIRNGFNAPYTARNLINLADYFDDNYLFSDACSLYFKGINIFRYLFDDWRKYVPVESRKEIIRQCEKTLKKK